MNCYDFMFKIAVDFKLAVNINANFGMYSYSANGDVIFQEQPDVSIREMVCKGTTFHRQDAFCNRFKLKSVPSLDTTGVIVTSSLPDYFFAIVLDGSFKNPRPWDDADPYYPRAVSVWDAHPESQVILINFSGSYPNFYARFEEWKDGAVATVQDAFGEGNFGTLTLTFKKPDPTP